MSKTKIDGMTPEEVMARCFDKEVMGRVSEWAERNIPAYEAVLRAFDGSDIEKLDGALRTTMVASLVLLQDRMLEFTMTLRPPDMIVDKQRFQYTPPPASHDGLRKCQDDIEQRTGVRTIVE